jgi:hypothetical protein
MTTHRAAAHLRRISVAMLGVLVLGIVSAGAVSALPYDGTNPVTTPCWDGSHTTYTLGRRTISSPLGDEGIPTPIIYDGATIGTVEILHSRYCATVWSRVKNLTGGTAQVKEALVTFGDSNGSTGRVEHWYPTVDTVSDNQYGWSNQYRDRASFSAKGGIFFAGAWRYAETARAVAWVQFQSNFANNPYACNHGSYPCKRWPILSSGLSVTRHYYIASGVHSMPKAGGGTVDIGPDVTFMFNEFNDVAASNPFFYSGTQSGSEVQVYRYTEGGIVARGGGFDANGDGLYETGELKLSDAVTWQGDGSDRGALCHEVDHLMGLGHIWFHDIAGIDNVGSKASCIGMGSNSGPRIDDVSALDDVYSGVVP